MRKRAIETPRSAPWAIEEPIKANLFATIIGESTPQITAKIKQPMSAFCKKGKVIKSVIQFILGQLF